MPLRRRADRQSRAITGLGTGRRGRLTTVPLPRRWPGVVPRNHRSTTGNDGSVILYFQPQIGMPLQCYPCNTFGRLCQSPRGGRRRGFRPRACCSVIGNNSARATLTGGPRHATGPRQAVRSGRTDAACPYSFRLCVPEIRPVCARYTVRPRLADERVRGPPVRDVVAHHGFRVGGCRPPPYRSSRSRLFPCTVPLTMVPLVMIILRWFCW